MCGQNCYSWNSRFARSDIAFAPVEEIIVKDIDDNAQAEIIAVQKKCNHFAVLDSSGQVCKRFQKALIYITDLDNNRKCEFLVFESESSSFKTLCLIDHEFNVQWRMRFFHTPDYRLKNPALFRPFIIRVFDVNRDGIAEIAVENRTNNKITVLNSLGKTVDKKDMLEYLPNLVDDFKIRECPYIFLSSVEQRENRFYLDIFGKDKLVYYRQDKKGLDWFKDFPVYNKSGKLLWTFKMDRKSFSPFEYPHFFNAVEVIDFNKDNLNDILLGGDNRIFIISSTGKLVHIIKNVFL